MNADRKLIYFGCIREAGHYYWTHENYGRFFGEGLASLLGCNPRLIEHFDGVYPPWPEKELGRYQESIVPPVRIVAWWDRTVDSRPGSNSALIGTGYDSAQEMLDDAPKWFPSVMKRQPRPVPNTPSSFW